MYCWMPSQSVPVSWLLGSLDSMAQQYSCLSTISSWKLQRMSKSAASWCVELWSYLGKHLISVALHGMTLYHIHACEKIVSDLSLSLSPSGGDNSTCIFSSDSPLYTSGFRETFRPVDSLIDNCEDLDQFWTYLVGLMSLSFIGFVVSLIAIFSDCITPCAEEKYNPQDRTEVWLLLWLNHSLAIFFWHVSLIFIVIFCVFDHRIDS